MGASNKIFSNQGIFSDERFYSERLSTVKESPTLAISALSKKLKREGRDIINMSAGEIDFNTPDVICDAAAKGMRDGYTKYTEVGGLPELKDAIKVRVNARYQVQYKTENILVSSGAKQALFNALMATLNRGDEVVIVKPYWVSYPEMVSLNGGTPVFCEMNPDDFSVDVAHLERLITQKTKWIILNSPSNPSGVVYKREMLLRIAEVLGRYRHVGILSDDTYCDFVYEGGFVSLLDVAPELVERTVIIGSLSKSCSMTGWRIGYAIGSQHLIRRMITIQSQSTSCPCSIAQIGAIAAFQNFSKITGLFRAHFKQRRDLALKALSDVPQLNCYPSQGAFYLFPSCAMSIGCRTPSGKVMNSAVDFASYLLDSFGVSVVPGEAFGVRDHFRLSYALSEEDITEGCARIVTAYAELRKV